MCWSCPQQNSAPTTSDQPRIQKLSSRRHTIKWCKWSWEPATSNPPAFKSFVQEITQSCDVDDPKNQMQLPINPRFNNFLREIYTVVWCNFWSTLDSTVFFKKSPQPCDLNDPENQMYSHTFSRFFKILSFFLALNWAESSATMHVKEHILSSSDQAS